MPPHAETERKPDSPPEVSEPDYTIGVDPAAPGADRSVEVDVEDNPRPGTDAEYLSAQEVAKRKEGNAAEVKPPAPTQPRRLVREIEDLITRHKKQDPGNTLDYVLATFLHGVLKELDAALRTWSSICAP